MKKFFVAKQEDIPQILRLDKQLWMELKLKKGLDFIQPLRKQELEQGLIAPSKIFITYDDNGYINGFIFLKEMNNEEEKKFRKAFENFKPGNALLIRQIGFYPSNQKEGHGIELLRRAKYYACQSGFEQFAGSIHPDDIQSQKAILSIWEKGKALHFDNQCIEVKRKERYLRQRFLLDLV